MSDLQWGKSWTREGESLTRKVECPSFLAAIELVQRVALVAEELNHHPDIDIRWTSVIFMVTTHSTGTLTQLDVNLTQRIDALIDG